MSGGGGGSQKQTTTTSQNLPAWEQPVAKGYLSSLMGYVFPGAQVPQNWFSTGGFGWPTGGPQGANAIQAGGGSFGGGGASGGWGGGGGAASMMNQIDPTGTAYGMFSPMISGSPFLQQMAANDPAAIVGATSPLASSQLSGSNLYGLPGQGSFNPLGSIPGYQPALQNAQQNARAAAAQAAQQAIAPQTPVPTTAAPATTTPAPAPKKKPAPRPAAKKPAPQPPPKPALKPPPKPVAKKPPLKPEPKKK